jgi:hypothetical protein
MVSFHWARALGTDWQRMAVEPWSRYPGLHSNRTIEPAENSEPILLPYLGSGTELHWVSLVRGTARSKAQTAICVLIRKPRHCLENRCESDKSVSVMIRADLRISSSRQLWGHLGTLTKMRKMGKRRTSAYDWWLVLKQDKLIHWQNNCATHNEMTKNLHWSSPHHSLAGKATLIWPMWHNNKIKNTSTIGSSNPSSANLCKIIEIGVSKTYLCLLQHPSLQQRHGNNLSSHWWMVTCGPYTYTVEFPPTVQRRQFCHFQQHLGTLS